eukprot:9693095-Ditylum_brightwellii.AAC.1
MLPLAVVGMQRIVVIFSWWRKDGLLETNRSVEGGSATDVARRFDYTLGLASQGPTGKLKLIYDHTNLPEAISGSIWDFSTRQPGVMDVE